MFGRNNEDEVEHPALARFSPTLETLKHMTRKALKWAAVGALVGGLIAAALPILGLGTVGGLLGTFGLTGVTSAMAGNAVTSFITGAIAVGGVSALIGGISGLASAEDAVADRKEEVIAAYERAETRNLKMEALRQRQENTRLALAQKADMMGIAGGHGLPMGLDSNERGLS